MVWETKLKIFWKMLRTRKTSTQIGEEKRKIR